jgi:hypothetical protein
MSRIEATNSFTDGMVKDLNPINTPNTALTDCLNGTIITYDGNEYSLQNDRGNYALTDCKLSENFLPMGVAEYGSILYIVSYNPLTKETEIGSFPSTRELQSIGEGDISGAFAYSELNKPYTELVQNTRLFTFSTTDPSQSKLNPGDKYIVLGYPGTAKYQEPEFYVIDENKKIYPLTDVHYSTETQSDDYELVNWEIPGWLAFKNHIAEIDDSQLILLQSTQPSLLSSSGNSFKLKFRAKVVTSDHLIYENDSATTDLSATLSYIINNSDTSSSVSASLETHKNYNNGQHVYYHDFEIAFDDLKSGDTIKFEMTPYLLGMSYPSKTFIYTVANKVEVSSFNVGDSLWNYSISDDSVTLNFNTSGITTITNVEDLTLKYNAYDYLAGTMLYQEDQVIGEWNPYSNIINMSIVGLNPESIYVFKFTLHNADESKALFTIYKIMITSELMNGLEEVSSTFDKIPFDKWFNTERYEKCIKNKTLQISSYSKVTEDITEDSIKSEGSNYYEQWLNNNQGYAGYKTFILEDDIEGRPTKILPEGFTLKISTPISTNVAVDSAIEVPHGSLWTDVLNTLRVKVTTNTDSKTYENTISFNQNGTLDKTNDVLFNTLLEGSYCKETIYKSKIYKKNLWTYSAGKLNVDYGGVIQMSIKDVNKKNTHASSTFGYVSGFTKQGITGNAARVLSAATSDLKKYYSDEFSQYDVILIRCGLWSDSRTSSLNGAWLTLGIYNPQADETTSVLHVNSNDERDFEETYYIAIPGNESSQTFQLFPISDSVDAQTAVENLASSFTKYKGNDDAKVGYFLTMDEATSSETSGINVTSTGTIPAIQTFKVSGRNLLTSAGRGLFCSDLSAQIQKTWGEQPTGTSFQNFATTEPTTSKEIALTPLSESLDTTLSDAALTTFETVEEKLKTTIDNKNKAVSKEIDLVTADQYLKNGPSETVYICDDSASDFAKQLKSYLEKPTLSNTTLRVVIGFWPDASYVSDRVDIGKVNDTMILANEA